MSSAADHQLHPYLQAIANAPIAKASKKQYLRILGSLKQLVDDREWEEIVRRPGPVYARIAKAYPNQQTRKAYVSGIKSIFKHYEGLKTDLPHEYQEWHKRYTHIDKRVNEHILKAEPSEREARNWVTWAEVLEKERHLAATEYGSTAHLILAMHCLIPPLRLDFGVVKLHSQEPGAVAAGSTDKRNYIVFSSTGATLTLNKFKTSKRYRSLHQDLPVALVRIILENLKQVPREWLFVNDSGAPYTNKGSYAHFIRRALSKLFAPRLVSVSLLRHSFISSLDYNASTPGELFDTARAMCHSLTQQQLYRRKVIANTGADQQGYPQPSSSSNQLATVELSFPQPQQPHQQQQQQVAPKPKPRAPHPGHHQSGYDAQAGVISFSV